MNTPCNTLPIQIDGRLRTPQAIPEELDEGTALFRVTRYRYPLYKDEEVCIERLIHEAQNDWEEAGTSDEIVFWSRSAKVQLSNPGDTLQVEVNGRTFLLTPDNPQQRLTLQITEDVEQYNAAENFSWPLRVDTGARKTKGTIDTGSRNLQIHGTPQFQRRVLEQLELLEASPALKRLLDEVRVTLDEQDDPLTIVELYVGTESVFGPWASGTDLTSGVVILYNPYDNNSDIDTALFKALYRAYGLITDAVLPGWLAP
ncbi:hypothetical protein [Pseudomonas akapageensis]|uniref:hypothetical protein n=1 Tax=Pseudomonas akapageensis TaxID=2609961 RepID=UPI00140A5A09|nr:hypothetical protein [Pseudomonas akapageensis]